MHKKIIWPEGKSFAFTVFDDTDFSTLENVREVYALLTDYGFRTTKSVWPIRGNRKPVNEGSTCEDKQYLQWVYTLKNFGFEIGYHLATFHSSLRDETILGIERFAELFGHYPQSMSNHVGCRESIYWGNYRLTGFNEFIYSLATRNRNKGVFCGHCEGNEYFWGDVCRERVKYVRNFVFSDINVLKECAFMPYHDIKKPYVNYWFASSEGSNLESFNLCISEQNQNRLEQEGGACIMYTHFGRRFYDSLGINPRFQFLMKRLSKKNGWFVPVSTLLDFLLDKGEQHTITDRERTHLERQWLWNKKRIGTT